MQRWRVKTLPLDNDITQAIKTNTPLQLKSYQKYIIKHNKTYYNICESRREDIIRQILNHHKSVKLDDFMLLEKLCLYNYITYANTLLQNALYDDFIRGHYASRACMHGSIDILRFILTYLKRELHYLDLQQICKRCLYTCITDRGYNCVSCVLSFCNCDTFDEPDDIIRDLLSNIACYFETNRPEYTSIALSCLDLVLWKFEKQLNPLVAKAATNGDYPFIKKHSYQIKMAHLGYMFANKHCYKKVMRTINIRKNRVSLYLDTRHFHMWDVNISNIIISYM